MTTQVDTPALLSSIRQPDWVDWAEEARAGDRRAFDRLARRFWPDLVRLARIVGEPAEAEDLAQETLLAAWVRCAQLHDVTRFPQWLRRSLVRRATRARRREVPKPLDEVPEPCVRPAEAARLELARCLATLTPRQRAAIYLTEVQGLSTGEAARYLGIRSATLRVHRFLALGRLRARLRGEER